MCVCMCVVCFEPCGCRRWCSCHVGVPKELVGLPQMNEAKLALCCVQQQQQWSPIKANRSMYVQSAYTRVLPATLNRYYSGGHGCGHEAAARG